MKRGSCAILLALALSACATAGFRPPSYTYQPAGGKTDPVDLDSGNVDHVKAYLRGVTASFDEMVRQAEWLKHGTELPIIGAAVFAPTWLALGKSTEGAIYAAGVGAGGGALSNYFGLRGREAAVVLARSAVTCVNREYISQITTARSLGSLLDKSHALALAATADADMLAKSLATSPTSAGEVGSAGDVAIAAADEIISKLKVKLAGMGSVPDYGSILKDLQAKQKLADASSGAVEASGLSPDEKSIAKSMADYSVRVATCVAQFQ